MFPSTIRKKTIFIFRDAVINVVLGGLLLLRGSKSNEVSINRRYVDCIVKVLSWIPVLALSMLPFCLVDISLCSRCLFRNHVRIYQLLKATIIGIAHGTPPSLDRLWRSLTQWIGGFGIVLFLSPCCRFLRAAASNLLSEATELPMTRFIPKIKVMARWLWIIYIDRQQRKRSCS